MVLMGVKCSGGQRSIMPRGARFVATKAGQMQFTLMLSSWRRVAPTERVRPTRPCLDVQYWGAKEKGYNPAVDAVMTMLGLKSCGEEWAEEAKARWLLRV